MAVDMFIKIGDVKGESADDKHKEEIDVLSWSWGMSQSGTTHMGGGGGSGKVAVNDLSFTKYVDSATNALFQACCEGKHYPEATLVVRKAGGTPLEYLKIKMQDLLITSISTGGSGGEDRLTENITLNFAKFTLEYQPQDEKGAAKGGPKTAGWDVAASKKI